MSRVRKIPARLIREYQADLEERRRSSAVEAVAIFAPAVASLLDTAAREYAKKHRFKVEKARRYVRAAAEDAIRTWFIFAESEET